MPDALATRCRRALLVALALLAAIPSLAAALPYVALDAGHGGTDPGATGRLPAGAVSDLPPRADEDGAPLVWEMDVTMDVTRRLEAVLRARGFQVLMTRTGDLGGADRIHSTVRSDLAARVAMANEAGIDVFVSIHANALRETSTGTETYHHRSSSAAARELAGHVQRRVVERLGLPDRGVRRAGFYVLARTVAPAVLVEGAFVSNPDEAALLAQAATRQALAEAVGQGIVDADAAGVFRDVPPVAKAPARKPLLGPWRKRPPRVPAGYRLVRTGKNNPVGRGGWLAVISTYVHPPAPLSQR